ncbi:MAG TPA: carboxypeptidase-like regulatory domain-containing protein, partial [Bryobacteraceae bacterium]
MKALCLALGAVFAAAQNPAPLEIRGTVIESRLGVAGATVTLYEFGAEPENATTRTIFATTSTDPKGEFAFHPARTGEYYVEVTKEGYFAESFDGPTADPIDTIGDPVSLDKNHSSQELRFSLVRLGELRGRVIDEDGMPLANLRVGLLPGTSTPVVTDADGYFAAIKLRPGTYVVRIGPERGSPEI